MHVLSCALHPTARGPAWSASTGPEQRLQMPRIRQGWRFTHSM
jgi:hypothetical protein